ncbi:VOC family protein [Sphingomonas daechungensis]|uniref:VOC family protein n=1 Tax=Sphingomonas daechungensis TaxID=1176646 RepID=UPI003784494A
MMAKTFSNLPAVHSIDHFALTVPDLSEARRFYELFGLDVVEEKAGSLALYASGSDHRWARLVKGPVKRLSYISFGAFVDDIAEMRKRVFEAGVTEIDPPENVELDEGFWFRDLNGVPIQILAAPKVTLDAKEIQRIVVSHQGIRNAPLRGASPRVRPTRLSHLMIFVPDVAAAIDFYERGLGLDLSDSSDNAVAFMHARYGCDHHLLAFAKSTGAGYHHSSWDVPSFEHVGLGAAQMQEAGFDQGWGVGRHVLGSNYFYYARDPWGSYAEYSYDIDYIPGGSNWVPTSPPAENSLSLWGPKPPSDFIINHEVEEAAQALAQSDVKSRPKAS